jgi:hypothetical protein
MSLRNAPTIYVSVNNIPDRSIFPLFIDRFVGRQPVYDFSKRERGNRNRTAHTRSNKRKYAAACRQDEGNLRDTVQQSGAFHCGTTQQSPAAPGGNPLRH